MQTVFSPRHAGHAGNVELMPGEIVPAFELPRRAEIIRARIAEVGLGPVVAPSPHGLEVARRVHAPDYVDFLPRAWPMWAAAGRGGTAMPFVWPVPGLRADVPPADIDGLLGFYAMDGGATFVAGTWDAVKASYDVALSAAALVRGGADAAFALCRPPGHHAGPRFAGGYCFLNNAAAAAEWLRENGAERVSVLDIDYHHGNGTQAIFYARGDVQVVNIHADPDGGVSILPRPCRRARHGRGRGIQPQPAAAARHRLRRLVEGAGDRLRRGGRLRARPRSWSRSASTPSAATRSAGSGWRPGTTR